jgi:hypothetical protein
VYYTTINTLEDDILLGIFSSYLLDSRPALRNPLGWRKISHVCRRWRHLILSSAFHLGLQILCTHGTPIVDKLNHLPPIPLVIEYTWTDVLADSTISVQDGIGICHALRLHNRVRSVKIFLPRPTLDEILMVMNSSFPILEHLILSSTVTVTLPKAFAAPNLRHLSLRRRPSKKITFTPIPCLPGHAQARGNGSFWLHSPEVIGGTHSVSSPARGSDHRIFYPHTPSQR